MRTPNLLLVGSFTMLLCASLSCGGSDDDHPGGPTEGVPTKATCPMPQALTYDDFGKGFFDSYCLRCHSTTVKGDKRNGAPDDHNFDTVGDIRTLAEHIDQLAGAGPAGTNTVMPRNAPIPGDDERRKLAEWLACGAP